MADRNKRKTLKLLSISGLGLGVGAFSAASGAINDTYNYSGPSGSGRLSIQVFCTTAVQQNTVTIVNQTDKSVVLNKFFPNVVVFDDRLVELNSLLTGEDIVIGAGQAWASEIDIWQLLAQPVMEYLWAEHSMKNLTEQTRVVSLAATLMDDKTIVYADPNGVSLVA